MFPQALGDDWQLSVHSNSVASKMAGQPGRDNPANLQRGWCHGCHSLAQPEGPTHSSGCVRRSGKQNAHLWHYKQDWGRATERQVHAAAMTTAITCQHSALFSFRSKFRDIKLYIPISLHCLATRQLTFHFPIAELSKITCFLFHHMLSWTKNVSSLLEDWEVVHPVLLPFWREVVSALRAA